VAGSRFVAGFAVRAVGDVAQSPAEGFASRSAWQTAGGTPSFRLRRLRRRFRALDVLARARVYLDVLALLQECRALDLGARLQLARLGDVRGRVAADARLAVFDLEDHVVGRLDADRPVVEQHDLTHRPLLEPLPGVADDILVQLVLLVARVVHEDELIALAVEELGIDRRDVGLIERVAALVGSVQHRAADQVLQLALIQGLPFARLDEVTLGHQVRVAVDLNFEPFAKIAGVVCHDWLPTTIYELERLCWRERERLISAQVCKLATIESTISTDSRHHADSSVVAAKTGLQPPVYSSWQQALKDAVRDPFELCRILELPDEWAARARQAEQSFPLFAPRSYVARMRTGDAADPLLRQVLPLEAETEHLAGYARDPVGDQQASLLPGLLHKYEGRVLMVATGACAVHCRYCFRRHFPYGETPHSPGEWEPALKQIAEDRTIHEVILSGGDPLTLVDSWLANLAERIAAIAHVRRLRVHTRLPVMIPERVTPSLLGWLRDTRLAPVVVIHANHPAELQGTAAAAVRRLVAAGIPTLNQAVLLRGVNDSAKTLIELSERLLDLGVMPYYLHQLDRVAGAAHFEVPVSEGLRLANELRRRLPGYAVPRYVREIAGEPHKTPLA
jgi:EF-P beta-lysylation protein EpmB